MHVRNSNTFNQKFPFAIHFSASHKYSTIKSKHKRIFPYLKIRNPQIRGKAS
ncbi:hypothetical protein Fmac_025979 [Flemingia macrophylla]|uniref:Uncharacterized protein n=1 Tax=Flemingia macrophylla TaxID=520843 RepID=A0ABD1LDJ7_9FABA